MGPIPSGKVRFGAYARKFSKREAQPPQITQNKSSPIDFRSRMFQLTSMNRTSNTLTAPVLYFCIRFLYPSPLKNLLTPTVGQILTGKYNVGVLRYSLVEFNKYYPPWINPVRIARFTCMVLISEAFATPKIYNFRQI